MFAEQAADALTSASCKCAGKAYFITNAEPRRFWGFLGDMLEPLGYQRPSKKLPWRLIFFIAILVELIIWLLKPMVVSIPFHTYQSRKYAHHLFLSLTRASEIPDAQQKAFLTGDFSHCHLWGAHPLTAVANGGEHLSAKLAAEEACIIVSCPMLCAFGACGLIGMSLILCMHEHHMFKRGLLSFGL